MPPATGAAFTDVEAPSQFAAVQTPHAPPAHLTSNRAHSVLRKWYAIRWHLARTVFAQPVPFFTVKMQLKLGDFLIVLPIATGLIAKTAVECSLGRVGASGPPASIAMAIVFVLAVRNNSILLTATGLPFDRAIYYHKFFAGVTWLVTVLHGVTYLLKEPDHKKHKLGMPTQLSGALTFYAFTALVLFALEPIRRRFFHWFLRFHWMFFILIVVFGVTHGAKGVLIGFVPFVLDMVYRMAWKVPQFARESPGGIQASQVTIKLVANDIVRVQFPRSQSSGPGLRHEAGQYAFLCIPQVARLEWHPFTIASAPHEPHMTFYIRVLGDWTKKLAALAATQHPEDSSVSVLVDGPYGAVGIEMEHYSHLVFVSGGIGVTPMKALANDLYYTSKVARSRRLPVEKARFVWAVRDREMLQAMVLDETQTIPTDPTLQSWFPQVLTSTSLTNSPEHDDFYADFYLTTQDQDPSDPVDQQLALCLKHKQRPNIEKVLREVGESALQVKSLTGQGPKRVGVLVCGPAAMVSQVVSLSQGLTNDMGVAFDVHEETFAW
jgi:predicted ferric reductase